MLDLLTHLVGERPSWTFAAILVLHIAAGLTAVITGATAMLSPKRSGRHPNAGRTCYTALCVVCSTAGGMAAMRWPDDAYLVVLGTLSLASASVAYLARHYRWLGWLRLHILGMGTSYIMLLTAGASFWLQQMDAPRPRRNRMHIDVWVPHDHAEARIAAAIAAGGHLVTDQYAPAWWVLADAEGDEACVATTTSRD